MALGRVAKEFAKLSLSMKEVLGILLICAASLGYGERVDLILFQLLKMDDVNKLIFVPFPIGFTPFLPEFF